MAKTYINAVKYEVKLKFEIDGIVEKPDIIGAIFGQSEGLLGDEMDLKELQKNGKLGRIEIELTTAMGRTKGDVIVPSSMDMAETSLLAAGIESVDKVGPCEAKFEIISMDDTRNDKREEIKNRAKELLKKMMEKSSPETQELTEEIRENARAADIINYGPDKLPAGPDIDSSDEIIVVEGRADVLVLLKNQIRNVIGMNGSNIPKTIVDLSKKKNITLFVDGDRGGILNAKKLIQIADIEYIAKAPDGKEVEELTRKEILQALKKKLTPEEEFEGTRRNSNYNMQRQSNDRRTPRDSRGRETQGRSSYGENFSRENTNSYRENTFPQRNSFRERAPKDNENSFRDKPRGVGFSRENGNSRERTPHEFDSRPRRTTRENSRDDFRNKPRRIIEKILTPEEEKIYKPLIDEMKGSMDAKIISEKGKVLKKVKVKDIVDEIAKAKKPHAIVLDGVVTKRLVEAAEKAGAKYVIGARKGKLEKNEKVKAEAL